MPTSALPDAEVLTVPEAAVLLRIELGRSLRVPRTALQQMLDAASLPPTPDREAA